MLRREFNDRIQGAMQRAKAFLLSKYQISEHDTDDVIQEASIKALKKLKTFKGSCAFETWFIAICKSEAKELFRKNKKRESHISRDEHDKPRDLEWYEPDVLRHCDMEDRARLVNAALDKLSEKHREIIQIALSHSGSSQEVADLLKIPVNSARTRLHYAKKRLKKLIGIHAHKSNIQLTHD